TSRARAHIAFIAVDGLTHELATTRGFGGVPIPPMVEKSTTERWASVGTGVGAALHGVHAVEGARLRGGRHLVQALSSSDLVLLDVAPEIGLAHREPLPP